MLSIISTTYLTMVVLPLTMYMPGRNLPVMRIPCRLYTSRSEVSPPMTSKPVVLVTEKTTSELTSYVKTPSTASNSTSPALTLMLLPATG